MNHQAIYNVYPTVKRIEDVESGVIAYDADNNVVALDADAIAAETTAVVNARNLATLRTKRNQLLAATDWEIVKHKELGTTIPAALKTYRQELRDLPANTSDPSNPTWPVRS
jgi:hypothetical protein|tara:strand:+ start:282 stop:617 length:336 start_codon:yes stop_codon:yes gene_type:complete